jgi:hypothetical protein
VDFINGDRDQNGLTGQDMIFFNRGDKLDSINRLGQATALSLGGGILYSQLKLERGTTGLVLKLGQKDSVAFNDWYSADPARSQVKYLQIVIEGTRTYNPASSNPWQNQKVVVFDFQALVAAFDAAQAAGQRFNVADNLPQVYLWSSDAMAYGGNLAYQYGLNGNLDNVTIAEMQTILAAPEFSDAPQTFSTASAFAIADLTSASTTFEIESSASIGEKALAMDAISPGRGVSNWPVKYHRLDRYNTHPVFQDNFTNPDSNYPWINGQLDQMIQAMAGFDAKAGLDWASTEQQRPEEAHAILAASWQAAA